MSRDRRHTAAALAIAVVAMIGAAQPATAGHLPLEDGRWRRSPVLVRTAGFPTSDAAFARVRDGAAQWNAARTGVPIRAAAGRIADFDPTRTCGPVGTITLHWGETERYGDASAVALTLPCVDVLTDEIRSAAIVFDDDQPWSTSRGHPDTGPLGLCVTACEIDLWSVASHEVGHAMGFGHFAEGGPVCGDDDRRHTMCPTVEPGTTRLRSFEPHEVDAFRAAY